jgi:hypothetical protein
VRRMNEFLAETADSVIDAAQRHSTISLADIITEFRKLYDTVRTVETSVPVP